MKPCSVYCEPEKGIHVQLQYAMWPDPPASEVGRVYETLDRYETCVEGCVRILAFEPATEAPPTPMERYPYPFLCRVQVLP